jgi:pimeloyl-ACP methyl ester carboxylesterase
MSTVISSDGTQISYEKLGQGPAIILVGGGLDDGSENKPLAEVLSKDFTTYNYARRGRANSGDIQPYSVQKEIEDIEALIEETDNICYLFGISSGGALVLEAAASGLNVQKIAVYEVPYSLGEEALRYWQEYVTNLNNSLAEGRRGDALELFMQLAGSPQEDIDNAKNSTMWEDLKKIAPTLAYDAACLGNDGPPVDRLLKINQHTLVATGSIIDPRMSGLQPSFFADAADVISQSIPNSTRQTIENQSHVVDPQILAGVLKEFFEN